MKTSHITNYNVELDSDVRLIKVVNSSGVHTAVTTMLLPTLNIAVLVFIVTNVTYIYRHGDCGASSAFVMNDDGFKFYSAWHTAVITTIFIHDV